MSMSKRVGTVLAFLHLCLWGYIVYLIGSGGEPDWPMYWIVFLGIDFPVSLFYILAGYLVDVFGLGSKAVGFLPGPLGDVNNFLLPAVFFGLFGTWWWFLLPQLIARSISRINRSADRKS